MNQWKMFDADGHIRELENDIYDYLPEDYQSRREAVLYSPLMPHHGWHRQALASPRSGYLIPTLKDWQTALNEGDLEAAVIYPTRFMHIAHIGMSQFAVDLSRAYNDYLYDRFLRHDIRLKGIAVLPLQDVSAAAVELHRAVKEYGMVGGLLPADGMVRPLGHPEVHPIYEEADRLDCMLAVHAVNSLRNNDAYVWLDEAATLAHVVPQMRQFTSFMFSGVLTRLDRLRLAFLEAGCGWVPYLISKMEPRMRGLLKPSELIAQGRVYFQCGEESTTMRDLELLGDHCLFWASDFPHEGILNMKVAVQEFLSRSDIPPESKRRIGSENPRRLYGIS